VTSGFRITLWILSSLAVLWSVIALVGSFSMGGMMGGRGMMGGGMMGDSATMGIWMVGMMMHTALTWVVMLGLVGVFVYLIITTRRKI
jgi:hypothetical protein